MKDAAAFETYRTRAASSIAQHGGRHLVRGGPIETLEGGWTPRSIIVVEFADLERARLLSLARSRLGTGGPRRGAEPQPHPCRRHQRVLS